MEELNNKKVLVVDDEKSLLLAIKYALEETGANVTICNSGDKALEELKTNNFDVIFLDIRMPYLNGVETLQEIKKLDEETPVVMIAANSIDTLIPEATKNGAADFLFKPFDIEDVIKKINKVTK